MHVRDDAPPWIAPLNVACRPFVMKNFPGALSFGRRCVEEGYALYWPAGALFPIPSRRTGTPSRSLLTTNMPFLDVDVVPKAAAANDPQPVKHGRTAGTTIAMTTEQTTETTEDSAPSTSTMHTGVGALTRRRLLQASGRVPGNPVWYPWLVQARRRGPGRGRAGAWPGEDALDDDAEPRRDLCTEATSLRHPLLHERNNSYFEAYQESVFARKANQRRHNAELFTNFGGLIAMHHVNTNSLIHSGLTGEGELLVVSDIARASWALTRSEPKAQTAS